MHSRLIATQPFGRLAILTRLAAVAAACALALTCAARASATPTWLSPSTLSATNTNTSEDEVALAPDGEAVAVWQLYNGSHEIIQVSVRPASGGAWQTPVTLSDTTRNAYHPQVAIDAQGEAIAVWEIYNGSHFVAQASVRPAAGSWQTPANLSETSHEAYSPTIAFGPDGEAIAAWEFYNGSHAFIQASTRAEAGASWQTPANLSDTSHEAYEPQLTINDDGEAVAAWQFNNGSYQAAQAAARPPSGSWQTPVNLSPASKNAHVPHLALNDEGEAIATWTLENGSKEYVQSATRSGPSASWTAPLTQAEGEPSFEPSTQQRAAIDAHGEAIAMWSVPSKTGGETVGVAVRPGASEAWQAPVTLSGSLSNSNSSQSARVAFDSAGEALAVWGHYNGSYTAIQASRLSSPTGSWSTAQNISESANYGFEPQVAVDPGGDAMAVWDLSSGSHSYIQAAPYVAAGPLLSEVSVPTAGEVDESLSFSVDPLDAWTSLGATEWSFGDGQHETGTSVTHAYAAAGSYEVEVESADVLGNVASAKRTLVVQAPPQEEAEETEEASATEPPAQEARKQEPPAQEVASVSPPSAPTTTSSATSPTAPSALELLTKAPQPLINTRSLALKVACGDTPCSTSATGWLKLPGQHKTWRLASSPGAVAENTTGKVLLAVPGSLRHAVRAYLHHHPHYQVELHLTVTLSVGGQPSQSVSSTLPIWTYPGFR